MMLTRLILALALLAAAPAAAWDNRGHRLTGELAYDRLQATDPAAVQAIIAIMARHPDRQRFERNLAGLTGEARNRKLFGLMARWPDDVRDTKWDMPDWHYALKVVHGWTWLDGITIGKAEDQWADKLATARNAAATPQARAVSLCWLLHIGGDMHQPLHRGHRMDWGWLQTDRAGTIAWVRRGPGWPPMALHQFWDKIFDPTGNGGGDEDGDVMRLHARFALRAAPLQPKGNFARWLDESEALARTSAYSDTALLAVHAGEPAPVMSPAYGAMVRRVSEQRVITAGVRMGEALRGLR